MKFFLTLIFLLTIFSSTAANGLVVRLDFELECMMERNWTYVINFKRARYPSFDSVIIENINGTSNTAKNGIGLSVSNGGDYYAMYEIEIDHDCNEESMMKTIQIPFKDVVVRQSFDQMIGTILNSFGKVYTIKSFLNITNKSGTLKDVPVDISYKQWY